MKGDTTTMAKLAKEMGLSHVEMLEHVAQLQAEGLVIRLVDEVTGGGVWVATEVLEDWAQSLSSHPQ